jgi:outer membrane receptor protein involved in Fe transport
MGPWIAVSAEGTIMGSIKGDVSYFFNDGTNLILYSQNAQRVGIPVNIGHARIQGVETSVALSLGERFKCSGSLTYTHTENLGDEPLYYGNQLPRIPEWEAHTRTGVRLPFSITLGHRLDYMAENYWDGTNWYASAPRAIHGVYAMWDVPKYGLTLGVDVMNVGDQTTQIQPVDPLNPDLSGNGVIGITDFVGLPLPGRTWMVRLEWTQ